MPYLKVLVHCVWATKHRKPFLKGKNKDAICLHIREYAKSKSIHIININGYLDHLHCLVSLDADQNLMTVINLIKGESSFWANKNLQLPEKFGWQNEYFAVSVSASNFDALNNYINHQEEHHQKSTFNEEYDQLLAKYGLENMFL